MQDYQRRVIDERDELALKILKLRAILASDPSPEVGEQRLHNEDERELMLEQLCRMVDYGRVLNERLGSWVCADGGLG